MPRGSTRLTARQVQTIKAPGFYADGGGLYLQVTASGAKSWILRFQLADRRRDMGLGSAELFSLASAREKAIEARRQIANGIDPIDARRSTRQAVAVAAAATLTFRQCGDRYISAHKSAWRSPKGESAWEGTLRDYVYPVIGALPVEAIDTGLVIEAVEPIWAEAGDGKPGARSDRGGS